MSSPGLTGMFLSSPKITKVPYYSSPISIWLLSLSLSLSRSSHGIFFSQRVCALWTKISSSASCLHKRLVFSHLDSSLTFNELLNSTQCYADWVGAPKLIITQPRCLLQCVHCVTKKCTRLFSCLYASSKILFVLDGQMRETLLGRSMEKQLVHLEDDVLVR